MLLVLLLLNTFYLKAQYIPYRKGNLWGYCDSNKRIVLMPQYDMLAYLPLPSNAHNLSPNHVFVLLSPYIYKSPKGEYNKVSSMENGKKNVYLLDLKTNRKLFFSELFSNTTNNTYNFLTEKGQMGVLSASLDTLFPPLFKHIEYNPKQHLHKAQTWESPQKWGYLNDKAEWKILPKYDMLDELIAGKTTAYFKIFLPSQAKVKGNDAWQECYWESCEIDTFGKELTPRIRLKTFQNMPISMNSSSKKSMIIQERTTFDSVIQHKKYRFVPIADSSWVKIDTENSNNWQFELCNAQKRSIRKLAEYTNFLSPSENRFILYTRNQLFTVMDLKGNEIISMVDMTFSPFQNGISIVKSNEDNLYGALDANGKTKIPFAYKHLQWLGDYLFSIDINGKYGYFDIEGNAYFED
jgi:hypothetical protein